MARLFFLLRWCRPAVLRVPSSKGRKSPSLLLFPTRSPPQPGRDRRTPPSHSGCTKLVQKLMPIWKADVQLMHINLRRPSWEPQRRTWRVDPRSKNHAHVEVRERRTWCTRDGSGAHGPRSADMGTRQARSARLCFPTRGSVARRRNSKRSVVEPLSASVAQSGYISYHACDQARLKEERSALSRKEMNGFRDFN